jgi:hypothetical protein
MAVSAAVGFALIARGTADAACSRDFQTLVTYYVIGDYATLDALFEHQRCWLP